MNESREAKALSQAGINLLSSAITIVIYGAIVNPLWDSLMPNLFGLPEISFEQAVGICALGRLIFSPLTKNN